MSLRGVRIGSIREFPGERFGPILQSPRSRSTIWTALIDEINAMGTGYDGCAHPRGFRAEHIRARSAVGNLYVNRNMIGAVVACSVRRPRGCLHRTEGRRPELPRAFTTDAFFGEHRGGGRRSRPADGRAGAAT